MSDLINLLIPRLEVLGSLVYWIIFLISFLESLAFIGLAIPGTTFMIVAGMLASQDIFNVGSLIAVVALGGVLGDSFSFYLGKQGMSLFTKESKFFKLDYLEKGQRFFARHGDKSIFFAKFIGPIRPVIPFVAGLCKMSVRKFLFFDILGAVFSAPIYVLIGYFFGQVAGRIGQIVGGIGIFSAVLIVVVISLYIFKRSVTKKGQDFFTVLRSFLSWVLEIFTSRPRVQEFTQKHERGVDFLKKRTVKTKFVGLPLTLLGIVVFILTITSVGLADKIINLAAVLKTDILIQEFLFHHRHTVWVNIFWFITYFGNVWVVILVMILSSVLMWKLHKREYLIPFYVTVVGGVITVYVMKLITARPRPEEVGVYLEHLFSFPSLHSIAAVVVYGFIAYFLSRLVKDWRYRVNIAFGAFVLILVIGFSRLYLGVHFFSDVIGGYLLGILWLWIGVSLVRLMSKA